MVVITTGRTLDIEYDVKALFSEWAIHRFLYKVSSLKAMQVELFLDESCLNSCELLMIKTKKNFASYCFKEHESWSLPQDGQTLTFCVCQKTIKKLLLSND